jgi:hypothetical protein
MQPRELVIVADFVEELPCTLAPFIEELSSAWSESQRKRVFNFENLVDGVPRHVYNGCFPLSSVQQCRGSDFEETHSYESHLALVRG